MQAKLGSSLTAPQRPLLDLGVGLSYELDTNDFALLVRALSPLHKLADRAHVTHRVESGQKRVCTTAPCSVVWQRTEATTAIATTFKAFWYALVRPELLSSTCARALTTISTAVRHGCQWKTPAGHLHSSENEEDAGPCCETGAVCSSLGSPRHALDIAPAS